MSKIQSGNPYAPDASSYIQSLIPPEPNTTLNIHDRAQRDNFLGGFNPDPELTGKIFRDFHDINTTLADIAALARTTIEALTAWLARPDIAQRIANFQSAAAARLRLIATERLHIAAQSCTIILQEFNDAACHEAGLQSGRGCSPSEHIRRDRETARKASQMLYRLARFQGASGVSQRSGARSPGTLRATSGVAPLHLTHATFDTLPNYTFNLAAPQLEPKGELPPITMTKGGTGGSSASGAHGERTISRPPPAPNTEPPPTPVLPPAPPSHPSPHSPRADEPPVPPIRSESSRCERNTLSPGRETRETNSPEPAERATHFDNASPRHARSSNPTHELPPPDSPRPP